MSLLRAAALALIAPSAQSLQNGLALTPPRGFSTWQQWPDPGPDGTVAGASGHSISEETSRRYMNGIVSAGLNKLNYTYFIVDEPCFIGRDASGALLENKTTWPCAPTLPQRQQRRLRGAGADGACACGARAGTGSSRSGRSCAPTA